MICPVVKYAPSPAMIPSIANLPLSVSATFFCGSIGFVALLGAYITTGQIIPGIF